MAARLPAHDALVLIAISGKESSKNPRHNHLVHEKMLYAEAVKRGFERTGRPARVLTMASLENEPDAIQGDQPTVVLGYIMSSSTTSSSSATAGSGCSGGWRTPASTTASAST